MPLFPFLSALAFSAFLLGCQSANAPIRVPIAEDAGSATSPVSTGTGAPSDAKSIREWVTCDGRSDDAGGVARAFAAARHRAFTLVVDCPVKIHIGMDISRTIFIDDGATVEFRGAGKFTIDNVFHPAFVIANSHDISLINWNVEYVGSLPVDPDTRGFEEAGHSIPREGHYQPASAFNDISMTSWLATNRGIKFDKTQGYIASVWVGPTNTSSVFYVTGDTARLSVTGLRLYVPRTTGGDGFIPMAFSLSRNYKSDQIISAKTPSTAQFMAVPHEMIFSDIDLDGTYMGWQGNLQDTIFTHIRSHRYSDLQDKNGATVGGVGKWFAPPHLFYLNYLQDGDPALFNKHIEIRDVVDSGPRVGVARDKGNGDSITGYALSLKIGGVDCSVNGYKSSRPDGFLDVLSSDGLTISNVDATYDSAFLNNTFPGWRFPDLSYKRVTFENIVLTDVAVESVQPPIGYTNRPSNENIVFRNVNVNLNRWAGIGPLPPHISGQHNDLSINFAIQAEHSRIAYSLRDDIELSLRVTPDSMAVGKTTAVEWTSKNATNCTAIGAWNGTVELQGSKSMRFDTPGPRDMGLRCSDPGGSLSVSLPVPVTPR